MTNMLNKTEVRTILFDQRLSLRQVPFFRGAMVSYLAIDNELLHNHCQNGFRYAYPLIQYKAIDGKAAIVSIGSEAISIMGPLKKGKSLSLTLGNDVSKIYRIAKSTIEIADFSNGEELVDYYLESWIPLNQRNFTLYCTCNGLIEKIVMLQNILTGNILSAAKGIGIHIKNRIICHIKEVEESRFSLLKDIKMQAFNIKFSTNILLPEYIGLGKGASRGFGIIFGL